MSFGEKLSNLRKQQNMTQVNLAEKLNLSKANISKYESGDLEPNLTTLNLISNIFNVSIDFLLDNDETNLTNKKEPPPFTEEDILRMLAEVKNLSDDEVAHLKSTLKIFDKTHEARQISEKISEKLNEETSDELAPESN